MTLANIQKALAILVGAFVFYTAASGPFEGLIQRAVFLALVSTLGFALYPLGAGTRWRPMGPDTTCIGPVASSRQPPTLILESPE